MNRRTVSAAIIAMGFVACMVLAIEDVFRTREMLAGFVTYLIVLFGIIHARHPFVVFVMVFAGLLLMYLTWKNSWYGVIPGGVLGVVTTILLSIGWVNHHRPFSRSRYIKGILKDE